MKLEDAKPPAPRKANDADRTETFVSLLAVTLGMDSRMDDGYRLRHGRPVRRNCLGHNDNRMLRKGPDV